MTVFSAPTEYYSQQSSEEDTKSKTKQLRSSVNQEETRICEAATVLGL